MKKRLLLLTLVASLGIFAACGGAEEPAAEEPPAESQEATTEQQEAEPVEKARGILLSTTIGPADAGLIDALIDAYTEEHPEIAIRYLARGTGKAIELAEAGNIDMLIVHAKSLEEAFVEAGYGTERIDMMYNDFVILGPEDDPAGLADQENAQGAMTAIADGAHPFISRGDQSGTNVKEMEVWAEAGIQPDGDWYEIYEKGSEGNKATLLYTDEQGAYTIMDRATFIANEEELNDLVVLFEGDDILYNYISIVPVNPAEFDNINAQDAADFIDWLTSQEAQELIANFGFDEFGEHLFFPNAEGYEAAEDNDTPDAEKDADEKSDDKK